MGRLQDKVAVILGAAGNDNMGQVIARRFAAEGAKVVAAGRNADSLNQIAAEIDGLAVRCDVTQKSDLEALRDAALNHYEQVDIAINCTGWGLMKKLLRTTEEQLDKITDLQFKGSFFFLQVFADQLSQQGGGSIVQISSASVYCPLFHHAAYIGTKAGADAVMRCFANEFGRNSVKINSIAPGLTATPMTQKEVAMPGLVDAFTKEYPLGRIGTSEDVANAALWLASDESFVTGQVIQANGGLTLRRNPMPWEINSSISQATDT